MLIGQPADEDEWKKVYEEAARVMGESAAAFKAPATAQFNPRGDFATATTGISYGGGQKVRRLLICLEETLTSEIEAR